MAARENAIKNSIMKYLNSIPGGYARKTHGGPYSGGWLDIVFCLKGHLFMFEVKTEMGVATKLQAQELERWRTAGATAEIVRSVDRVKAILNCFT